MQSAIQFASPTTPITARQETSNPKTAKRRRVNLACERCRTRKSRCDGRQPICANCDKAKADCVYREPAWHTRTQDDFDHERSENENGSSAPGDANYQHALEQRMRAMEERLRKFEGTSAPDERKSGEGVKLPSQEGPTEGHGLTNDAQSPGSVDAMGTVSFADEQDSAFFGPSSNIAFLGHITKAVQAVQDPSFSNRRVQNDSDGAIVNAPRAGRKPSRNSSNGDAGDPFKLPPENELLDLAQEFFANTGLLFPYVHADSFYETYARVKSKHPKTIRMSWLALCNMLLANAVSSSVFDNHSVRRRVERAEAFYNRGTALSRQVDDQGTSLEEVQSLLLATQYLQGTQRSVQTYTVHGRAVRAAFSLGLHSPDALRRFSSLDQEMRKRTWFACVIIDRNLSMTFGRPPSIPECFVKLPTPNTFHPTQGTAANGMPAHHNMLKCLALGFFNSTISLYRITAEVIDNLYGQNMGDGEQDSLIEILERLPSLGEKLQKWSDELPEYLKPEAAPQEEPQDLKDTRQRLMNILHLRLLNLRNLLHRPILQRLLDACSTQAAHQVKSIPRLEPYLKASVHALSDSATELIKLIHDNRTKKRALGAWWYSLYYTFNSALILLAVHLIGQAGLFKEYEQPADIGYTLNNAIETLASLDKGNMMIERCRVYLSKLVRAVLPQTHRKLSAREDDQQAQPGQTFDHRRTSSAALQPPGPLTIPVNGQQPVEYPHTGFTPGSTTSFGAYGDINDLDIGPFMTGGNMDFLSNFFEDPTFYQPQPPM